MVDQAGVLRPPQQSVGTTHDRPLCQSTQRQAPSVCRMVPTPCSPDLRCPPAAVDPARPTLHLPSMEPAAARPSEASGGEVSGDGDHPLLAERVVVPNNPGYGSDPTNPDPTAHGPPSTGGPSSCPVPQPPLVSIRLERQRAAVLKDGASSAVASILFDSPAVIRRERLYTTKQSAFIRWMEFLDLDPLAPNPIQLMNFLAYGFTHDQWVVSTVLNIKTAVLQMFDSTKAFDDYAPFNSFLKAIAKRGVKRPHHHDLDISPITGHLRGMGPNSDIPLDGLTRKLCWLLGTCGFMRPDDILCVDAAQVKIVNDNLELSVVFPKETRGFQRIINIVVLAPHPDPLLCPVAAFTEYRARTSARDTQHDHPKDPSVKYTPLVRYALARSLHQPVGAERISNHIKTIMRFLPIPADARPLKARAVGATLALMKGVGVEDIMIQGNWSTPAIVDAFYRLSRMTATNFTTTVLG
ncbi:hypothetical protein EDD21DRAFT_392570 [Dissophora ornata]|nr:hypothetical protein EDD21DRAFT_392570 [Dissophora ornata]